MQVVIRDDRAVLTRQGYENIQRELDEILKVKRPAVVQRIREARQLGDLSENFDYQDAKRTQGLLEARVRELQAILSRATVVENDGNGHVDIGSTVTVRDLDGGFEDVYSIVGPAESSPGEGKISHVSCVGEALMGKRANDIVTIVAPGGEMRYEIVSVE
jgi:transcription elongation factor GreA